MHPMIRISPPDVSIHDPAFAAHAALPVADQAVMDGAKAPAMTVVNLWADDTARQAARAEFDRT